MSKNNRVAKNLLVTTTLGNTILSSNSDTLVGIVEGAYLTKRASDLREGDRVLFHKEGIDMTLEEVEPHLSRSPRYEEARRRIHVEHEGDIVSRFRSDLIRGLVEREHFDIPFLNEKVYRHDDMDFTQTEYHILANALKQLLPDNPFTERPYADSTIHQWLTGETRGPRHWDHVFENLAASMPEFRIYTQPRDQGCLKDHYNLFTTVRQGIMRYLSTRGQGGTGSSTPRSEGVSLSLQQEIDIVVSEFMEDVNETYALARVARVQSIGRPTTRREQRKQSHGHLHKGIVANEPAEKHGKKITYRNMIEHLIILAKAIDFCFGKYFQAHPDHLFFRYMQDNFPEMRDNPFKIGGKAYSVLSHGDYLTHIINNGLDDPEEDRRISHSLFSIVYDGSIASFFGLETKQIYAGITAAITIENNIPKIIKNAVRSTAKYRDVKEKDLPLDVRQKVREVRKRYGYNATIKGKYFLSLIFENKGNHLMNLDNRQNMIGFIDKMDPQETSFLYTRAEVQEALDFYNIGYMMRCIHPNEFLMEERTILDVQ